MKKRDIYYNPFQAAHILRGLVWVTGLRVVNGVQYFRYERRDRVFGARGWCKGSMLRGVL